MGEKEQKHMMHLNSGELAFGRSSVVLKEEETNELDCIELLDVLFRGADFCLPAFEHFASASLSHVDRKHKICHRTIHYPNVRSGANR